MTNAVVIGTEPKMDLSFDKTEAEKISEAIKEYAAHTNIAFDPKKVALFNLCMAIGGISGSRVVAVRARLRSDKSKRIGINPAPATPITSQRTNGAPAKTATLPNNVAPSDIFGAQDNTI